MRPDGAKLVAKWRETGAWWAGETPVEVAEWRDRSGVKRRAERNLPPLIQSNDQREHHENSTEDISLRPFKTRDEKVSKACGHVPPDYTPARCPAQGAYAPLHVLSGYSFGHSVLLARELARRAANLGIPALCITDRLALTGAMEFAREANSVGIKPLIGATLELDTGGEIVLIARDKQGYESLSLLITACHLREPRLYPLCTWERLEHHTRGLLCLTGGDNGPINRLLLHRQYEDARLLTTRLVDLYGQANVFVEIDRSYLPWDIAANGRLLELADQLDLTPVAGGRVTHAAPEQFPAQDVLLCSETLCTVEEIIGRKPLRDASQPQVQDRPSRALNAERYLRSVKEMRQLYSDRPDLLENTLRVVDRCDDDVLPARTRLPQIFAHPEQALREITYAGAQVRHKSVTPKLHRRLDLELERITRLGFADHFLAAWDMCKWAEEQGIQHSGRGSVVDSAVAYCLGLSRIDAMRHNLHFDRFLPDDGNKRPDIDIDFEAKRRDDVRNYMITKYGAEHVATVSAIGAYCTRGIVREVGKALGLSPKAIGFLAKRIHGGVPPRELESALSKRPELRDSGIDKQRLHWIFKLGHMLLDVPRNMRAHSSGIVISDRPLAEIVPVQWSGGLQNDGENEEHLRIIQWDKRSAKHCFDKFDILCLRGQDVLSGTQERVRVQTPDFDVSQIPSDDEETYRAMRSGELIGIPQSASPAMRQAHMRLQTSDLHDASLVQAGIRPGVGGAVKINELIARRRGTKTFSFEHPDFEKILGITYGIIVFQEQVDQILQTFGGYTSGEAEDIREEIHKRRREDFGQVIHDEVIRRTVARGYTQKVAELAFEYVAGFKGYGFAQGHALAFAEISIRSIWCQQNHPAEYFASLLDAQPAGYYGPCTLVNEARSRGVAILPLDVNRSGNKFLVEDVQSTEDPKLVFPNGGIRVSLRSVHGLSTNTIERIVSQRGSGYYSLCAFVSRVQPNRDELDQLILCGAFDSIEPNRRALLWGASPALLWAASPSPSGRLIVAESSSIGDYLATTWRQLGDVPPLGDVPLLRLPEPTINSDVHDFTEAEKAIRERKVLGLDVARHLMAYERERIASKGGITTAEGKRLKDGEQAMLVGNPIRLRFPPTASGKRVVFFDLEDETGLLNITCFDQTYRRYGHAFVCSPYVTLIGHGQWRDGCTAFLIERAYSYEPTITELANQAEAPIKTRDFLVG
ncbi:MAG: DNA polymerase III subunit alpha [Armatimonadetes bacterium]|nr:DNA polymerase III subunit alpha [Armatimonadota bacterium]